MAINTMTVKLDNKTNFMFDKHGNFVSRLEDFQEGKLLINLHDSKLEVDASKIHIEYGNQYVTYYDNYKFILDDGFQDILIKAGYIVYKDYNISRIEDKEEGLSVRAKVDADVNKAIDKVLIEKVRTADNGYSFTIKSFTVNQIVNMNQARKDNNLPYYPFEKDMDKFGTMYLAIYAKKIDDSNTNDDTKFKFADSLISSIVEQLGPEYHYESLLIKKRLVKTDKI